MSLNRKLEHPALISVLLVLAVLAAYCSVGGLGFTNYDDPDYVVANPQVYAGLTWPGAGWAFASTYAANWHPVTWLSHMVDCQIFGLNPAGHHVTNLVFHAVNSILLFLLLRSLTGACWRSAAVAALFALHPLHVESVAWVSERKDVLSGFWGLLSLWAYACFARVQSLKSKGQSQGSGAGNQGLAAGGQPCAVPIGGKSQQTSDYKLQGTGPPRGPRIDKGPPLPIPLPLVGGEGAHGAREGIQGCTARAITSGNDLPSFDLPPSVCYGLSLLFFALGLMSKPMLVTWPCVLLLLDYWPLRRFELSGSDSRVLRRLIIEKSPFFALAAVSCVITVLVQKAGGAVALLDREPLSERVGNAVVSYVRYVGKVVWPSDLTVIYPLSGRWPITLVVLAMVALAAASLVALWQRQQRPWLLTGWAWYLGTLVPVIGLVQAGSQSMADRYMYLPAIGLFLMLVWGVAEFAGVSATRQALVGVMTAAGLTACMLLTQRQVLHWRSTETLFGHALAVSPKNYIACNQLGLYFASQQQRELAQNWYREAIAINPRHARAWNNLGCVLTEQGKYDEAITDFETALRLAPNLADAHNSLGTALGKMGKTDEALPHFLEALRLRPGYAEAHYNLANALVAKGQASQAIEHFRRAVQLSPCWADASNNLAFLEAKAGNLDEAIAAFRTVLRLQPESWQAHYGLGECLAREGKLAEAAEESLMLAAAHAGAGRFEEAVKAAKRADDLAVASGRSDISQTAQKQRERYRSALHGGSHVQ